MSAPPTSPTCACTDRPRCTPADTPTRRSRPGPGESAYGPRPAATSTSISTTTPRGTRPTTPSDCRQRSTHWRRPPPATRRPSVLRRHREVVLDAHHAVSGTRGVQHLLPSLLAVHRP